MFFHVERCTWKLNISHRILFICRSECVWKHVSTDTSYNTSETQTIVLRWHTLLLHMHHSKASVTWKEIQQPQMISDTAGRPICWMALGDLIDVAGISWEFKSMFSLLCATGNGRREHGSISDPETNKLKGMCGLCMNFDLLRQFKALLRSLLIL